MPNFTSHFLIFTLLAGFTPCSGLSAARRADDERALLEIASLEVYTSIQPWYAETRLDYVVANHYESDTEALLDFVLPRDAVVTQVQLEIDGATFSSRSKDRTSARILYERGVANGHRPETLDDARTAIYRLRLNPIEAQRSRRFSFHYVEPLRPTGDGWEFRLPLATNLPVDAPPIGVLITRIELATPGAVEIISGDVPPAEIRRTDEATSLLFADELSTPVEDLILQIATDPANDVPITLSEPPRTGVPGYFVAWFPSSLLPAHPDAPGRAISFVLDVSTSMAGERRALAIEAIAATLEALPQTTRFNIITFANQVEAYSEESVLPTADNVAAARTWLEAVDVGGATNLSAGLTRALTQPLDDDTEHRILLITDGPTHLGITDTDELVALLRASADERSSLSVVGWGPDVDASQLWTLARQGRGLARYLATDADARLQLPDLLGHLTANPMRATGLDFGGLDNVGVYPSSLLSPFAGLARFGRYLQGGVIDAVLTFGEDLSTVIPLELAVGVGEEPAPDLVQFFEDDFSDGAAGWAMLSGGEGWWTVDAENGTYQVRDLDGESVSSYEEPISADRYTIDVRMRLGSWEGKVVYSHANQHGGLRLDLMVSHQMARLQTKTGLHWEPFALETNRWYDVRVVVDGRKISTYIDGVLAHDQVPFGEDHAPDGWFGIGSYGPTHKTEFDRVVVYAGAPDPPPKAGTVARLWAWQRVLDLADSAMATAATTEIVNEIRRSGMAADIATPVTSLLVPAGALLSAPALMAEQETVTAVTSAASAWRNPERRSASLAQNYPNPFNPSTTIRFDIPAPFGEARLVIYNLSGQQIRQAALSAADGGEWRWDGRDQTGRRVASGIYIYRLETTGGAISRRMLLLR